MKLTLTDMGLLEMAAKASGYRLCHFLENGAYVRDDERNIGFDWNPLTNDGDEHGAGSEWHTAAVKAMAQAVHP